MPWIRISDNTLAHRKFARISDAVLGLWLRGLAYCALNLTNGVIPAFWARSKTDRGHAAELVACGLWDAVEGGWRIHDYLDFQPSKEDVERGRRLNRERQARWQEKHTLTHHEGVNNTRPSLPCPALPDHKEPPNGVRGNGGLTPMPAEVRAQMTAIFEHKGVPPCAEPQDSLGERAQGRLADTALGEE